MIDQSEPRQNASEHETNVEKLAPRQLLQLISVVSSSADLESAFRNLVDSLAMVYGNGQISIFTPSKGNVFTFFFSGGNEFINLENRVIKLGEGTLGTTLKNMKSLLIEDYATNKEFMPVQSGISSELVIPILFQSKLIALLDMINQRPKTYTTHDQSTLDALAASLGGVFFTLQKTQSLKENADREDRMNTLFTELSKTGTVEDSIRIAAREIAKMPEISQVSIFINPAKKQGSK
jgi:transcriptional regulator with GAF, ATPase, and Fis domain